MTDSRSHFGGTVIDVPVPGGTIQAETVGSGPAIVLLHGWTLDRRMWRPQMECLSGRFRLIAVDRRGFGRSTAPPDLSREMDDILAVADAFGIDGFSLVGMSQSGRVALRFALLHPARLACLVLQGTPLSGVTADPGGDEAMPRLRFAEMVRKGALDEMKGLWRKHRLMQTDNAAAQCLLDSILRDYEARDLARPSPPLDICLSDLASLRTPTLIITGADDSPWRRKVADLLAQQLPGSERASIAGAGHLCNLCKPAEFNQILTCFLEAHREAGQIIGVHCPL